MRTDARLKKDVIAELQGDAAIDPSHVGVRVGDGVVMLSGWLDNLDDVAAIDRAMQRVPGVKAVAMDFDVGEPPQRPGLSLEVKRAKAPQVETAQ